MEDINEVEIRYAKADAASSIALPYIMSNRIFQLSRQANLLAWYQSHGGNNYLEIAFHSATVALFNDVSPLRYKNTLLHFVANNETVLMVTQGFNNDSFTVNEIFRMKFEIIRHVISKVYVSQTRLNRKNCV